MAEHSLRELRRLRRVLRAAGTAREAIAGAGVAVPTGLDALVADLENREVLVDVRCVVCGRLARVGVVVGEDGDPEPAAVLCGVCDDRTEREVERLRSAVTDTGHLSTGPRTSRLGE